MLFPFAMLGLAAAAQLNPITRVATLLEGLSTKIKADEEKEQELYDSYKCWCMTVINTKSASIDKNKQKIAELAQYIEDLDSGRIELTSERTDREEEIKELKKSIAEETAMREEENTNYVAALDEMTKAIAALEKAVDVMSAGAPVEEGLVSMKTSLTKAVNLGKGFLAQRDVSTLLKALQPDVPDADWDKLNQDATFKMKYTSRSGEIQDILAEMLTTFKDNKEEAINAETKAADDSKKLLEAKEEALSTAESALRAQAGENGARGESKAECEEEKRDLEEANTRDEGYIADTKTTCAAKAGEWDERKRIRAEEIASIQQAIHVLRSDDARDVFKSSLESQGFIQRQQVKVRHVHHAQHKRGVNRLRELALKSGDPRVLMLAQKIRAGKADDPFAAVTESVDEMILDLKKEGEADMAEKEMCELERSRNTQKVREYSKRIDMSTHVVERLTQLIADKQKQIDEIDAELKDLVEQKREATEQREKEKIEYAASVDEDTKAIGLVENSMKVLEGFYKNNALTMGFVQMKETVEQPGGEAPTPPPATWDEAEYKGASKETSGIVALLGMIKADIEKDIRNADKEESDAQAAYDKMFVDVDVNIALLKGTKSDLEKMIATDEDSISSQKDTRQTDQDSMQTHIDFLKSIATACDFMAANFEPRAEKRAEEIDGLNNAKAIFQGAEFKKDGEEEDA
jgi:hypothetical protein